MRISFQHFGGWCECNLCIVYYKTYCGISSVTLQAGVEMALRGFSLKDDLLLIIRDWVWGFLMKNSCAFCMTVLQTVQRKITPYLEIWHNTKLFILTSNRCYITLLIFLGKRRFQYMQYRFQYMSIQKLNKPVHSTFIE